MISPYSERASIISQTAGPGGGAVRAFWGTFYKVDEGRLCAWGGGDLPHDLAQFVVESTLGS